MIVFFFFFFPHLVCLLLFPVTFAFKKRKKRTKITVKVRDRFFWRVGCSRFDSTLQESIAWGSCHNLALIYYLCPSKTCMSRGNQTAYEVWIPVLHTEWLRGNFVWSLAIISEYNDLNLNGIRRNTQTLTNEDVDLKSIHSKIDTLSRYDEKVPTNCLAAKLRDGQSACSATVISYAFGEFLENFCSERTKANVSQLHMHHGWWSSTLPFFSLKLWVNSTNLRLSRGCRNVETVSEWS